MKIRTVPLVILAVVATAAVPWLFGLGLGAQVPAIKLDVLAAKGLQVSPTFEGWYRVGATRYALFGYFNRNLEEIVNVPVGPDNEVTPGAADQGQPTRFFPGQHFGVFAVAVPGAKTEVTWTLTANGHKFSIPATLDPLYLIQPQRDDAGTVPWQHAANHQVRSDGPIGAGALRPSRRAVPPSSRNRSRSMCGSLTMVCRLCLVRRVRRRPFAGRLAVGDGGRG